MLQRSPGVPPQQCVHVSGSFRAAPRLGSTTAQVIWQRCEIRNPAKYDRRGCGIEHDRPAPQPTGLPATVSPPNNLLLRKYELQQLSDSPRKLQSRGQPLMVLASVVWHSYLAFPAGCSSLGV